jgi:hypothetical protein
LKLERGSKVFNKCCKGIKELLNSFTFPKIGREQKLHNLEKSIVILQDISVMSSRGSEQLPKKDILTSKKGDLTKTQNKALLEAVEILRKAGIPARLFFYTSGAWVQLVIVTECPDDTLPDGPPTRCMKCGRIPFVNPCPTCCSWWCEGCQTFVAYNKSTKLPTKCPKCGAPRVKSASCP